MRKSNLRKYCNILLIGVLTLLITSCSNNTVSTNDVTTGKQFIDNLTFIQSQYLVQNEIEAYEFPGRKQVENFMNNLLLGSYSGEHGYVKTDFKLLAADPYVKTDSGDLYYFGNFKKDKPDGMGILLDIEHSSWGASLVKAVTSNDIDSLELLSTDEVRNGISGIKYIGNFKDGLFDGYGMYFVDANGYRFRSFLGSAALGSSSKASSSGYYGSFIGSGSDDFHSIIEAEDFFDLERSFMEYEGEFEEGKYHGKGNYYFIYPSEDVEKIRSELGSDFKNHIMSYVGEFQKNEKEGKGRSYTNGILTHEGEYEKGDYHGKGTEFSIYTGEVIFEGEYVKGKEGDGKHYETNVTEEEFGDERIWNGFVVSISDGEPNGYDQEIRMDLQEDICEICGYTYEFYHEMCAYCHRPVCMTIENLIITIDDEMICNDCYELNEGKTIGYCDSCKESISMFEVEAGKCEKCDALLCGACAAIHIEDGVVLCNSCGTRYAPKIGTCSVCENSIYSDEWYINCDRCNKLVCDGCSYSYGDEYRCRTCVHTPIDTCGNCGGDILESYAYRICDACGDVFCTGCYYPYESGYFCVNCGDDYWCEYCSRRHSPNTTWYSCATCSRQVCENATIIDGEHYCGYSCWPDTY